MSKKLKTTRRALIKMLKTEKSIDCLDMSSYLTLLAIAVEIGSKDLSIPLAKINKCF